MKNKIFILLLAGLLLTGCGQSSTQGQISGAESNVTGQTQTDSAETTDSAGRTGTTNPFTSDSDNTTETEEQEPYILTFEASTIDGEEVTSDIFADSKLTMLNVWATYCNPCLSEMPDLGEIASEYDKADFQILGIICDVTADSSAEDLAEARDLIEQTKAAYPHLLLNQSLYYNLVGASDSVPTTYFVNQDGEVLGYMIGAQSKQTWINVIDSLLAEEGE